MVKVLFVCWGNVCRSQMAEGFYNYLSKSKDAESAGIEARSGREMLREVVETMKEVGIDVRKQKVKRLTEKMLDDADRVIVLCHKDKCQDFLLKHRKTEFRFIDDPYSESESFYRRVRGEIEELVKGLLK